MTINKLLLILLAVFAFILVGRSPVRAAATIEVVDGFVGGGFSDPTPVLPVGGNPGTTLGAQRLFAFQFAANKWGATLTSSVRIRILATGEPMSCTATTAVLASAGANDIERDFPGAPFPGTWYNKALADKLAGTELSPAAFDIRARFNINIGNPGCLAGTTFYLGVDNNHDTQVDLVTVLLHELSHGLGFQTFTNAQTGAPNGGFPSVYDRFLLDTSTGKNWLSMTDSERVLSALNGRKLTWNGPNSVGDVPAVLTTGVPVLRIDSPAVIGGSYDVGLASFGAALNTAGVSGSLVQALDPADGAGPLSTDACSALTNAAAVAGKIAVVDRGTCQFTVKVKNAQNAGAIGVVIADNSAGTPPSVMTGTDATVVIPSVRVTVTDGAAIKAELVNGVSGALIIDQSARSGADSFGRPQLFAPNPFQSGSNVSHWDTIATPNQLMEPAINADLTHNLSAPVDLTYSLMKDIGWESTPLPPSASVSGGNSQNAAINRTFSAPFKVTLSAPIAGVVVTFTAPSGTGATGRFATSGNFADAAAVLNSRVAIATTDANGTAIAPPFTANGQAGAYQIFATAPGSNTVTINATNIVPTAANVSVGGLVETHDGNSLRNALVVLAGPDGATLTTRTNSFGRFHFTGVAVGQTYVLRIDAKSYIFSPHVFSLADEIGDIELIAEP